MNRPYIPDETLARINGGAFHTRPHRFVHNPPADLIRKAKRVDRMGVRVGDEPTLGEARWLVLGAMIALALVAGALFGIGGPL